MGPETRSRIRERLRKKKLLPFFRKFLKHLMDIGLEETHAWHVARKAFPETLTFAQHQAELGVGLQNEALQEYLSHINTEAEEKKATVAGKGAGNIRESVRLDQFTGKKEANPLEIVQWVFDHIDVDEATPDMAPSPGAWSLLVEVRANKSLKADFYKTIWAKTLPSRSQLEIQEAFKDDGRRQIALIDQIRGLEEDDAEAYTDREAEESGSTELPADDQSYPQDA